MNVVIYNGEVIDLDAARVLMDDDLCESIHGTVESEQEFMDSYTAAHKIRFGANFVFA